MKPNTRTLFQLVSEAHEKHEMIHIAPSDSNHYYHTIPDSIKRLSMLSKFTENDIKGFVYLDEIREKRNNLFEDYTNLINEISEFITVTGCERIKENCATLKVGPQFLTYRTPTNYTISFNKLGEMTIKKESYDGPPPYDERDYIRDDD